MYVKFRRAILKEQKGEGDILWKDEGFPARAFSAAALIIFLILFRRKKRKDQDQDQTQP